MHVNGNYSGKPWLPAASLMYFSPSLFSHSVLLGQAQTFNNFLDTFPPNLHRTLLLSSSALCILTASTFRLVCCFMEENSNGTECFILLIELSGLSFSVR